MSPLPIRPARRTESWFWLIPMWLGNLGRGITQIHQDTGYEPAYDIDTAIADYINGLRADHDR